MVTGVAPVLRMLMLLLPGGGGVRLGAVAQNHDTPRRARWGRPRRLPVGSSVGLSFSLLYAPPEVIDAVERQERQVKADPAIDMWAIGVIAYELLTRARVFPPRLTRSEVRDQITGRAPLPWEDPEHRAEGLKQLRILKRTVLACLSREAKNRPTADRLLRSWNRLFDTFTSGSGAVGANTNDLAGRQAAEPTENAVKS